MAYFDYRKHGQFEWTGLVILFACLVFTLTAPSTSGTSSEFEKAGWQMPFKLREAISKRRPDAVCLGSVCYIRLGGETLAKAKLTSESGNYNGTQLMVLNRCIRPVNSITIRSWDMPHSEKKAPERGENADWDIYRPTLDMDGLWRLEEEYLRLFQEPDTEMR